MPFTGIVPGVKSPARIPRLPYWHALIETMTTRRLILLLLAALAAAAAMAGLMPAHRLNVLEKVILEGAPPPQRPDMPVFAATDGNAERLIAAGSSPGSELPRSMIQPM
jgi:hypothetical protein